MSYKISTIEVNHGVGSPDHIQKNRPHDPCFVSYVGKANFGAAEHYIREMYTEVYSAHALGAEISAIGGTFCISFMQLFTTDVYLNAFLSELKQIGVDYTVLERRPIRVASVADYRNLWRSNHLSSIETEICY